MVALTFTSQSYRLVRVARREVLDLILNLRHATAFKTVFADGQKVTNFFN